MRDIFCIGKAGVIVAVLRKVHPGGHADGKKRACPKRKDEKRSRIIRSISRNVVFYVTQDFPLKSHDFYFLSHAVSIIQTAVQPLPKR